MHKDSRQQRSTTFQNKQIQQLKDQNCTNIGNIRGETTAYKQTQLKRKIFLERIGAKINKCGEQMFTPMSQ